MGVGGLPGAVLRVLLVGVIAAAAFVGLWILNPVLNRALVSSPGSGFSVVSVGKGTGTTATTVLSPAAAASPSNAVSAPAGYTNAPAYVLSALGSVPMRWTVWWNQSTGTQAVAIVAQFPSGAAASTKLGELQSAYARSNSPATGFASSITYGVPGFYGTNGLGYLLTAGDSEQVMGIFSADRVVGIVAMETNTGSFDDTTFNAFAQAQYTKTSVAASGFWMQPWFFAWAAGVVVVIIVVFAVLPFFSPRRRSRATGFAYAPTSGSGPVNTMTYREPPPTFRPPVPKSLRQDDAADGAAPPPSGLPGFPPAPPDPAPGLVAAAPVAPTGAPGRPQLNESGGWSTPAEAPAFAAPPFAGPPVTAPMAPTVSVASLVADPPPPAMPAGWYADPAGVPGRQRYWDGSTWTEHYNPA